jgi:hypothetical protein
MKAMTPEDLESLQASVFRNSGRDPMWLGFWINSYVESENLNPLSVATEMGITCDSLALFCLCRTPRPDHFQEDLTVACERTGAKIDVAARIIRQEQAMMRWRDDGRPSGGAGWMLAASDADESPDSEIDDEGAIGEDQPG